MELTMTTGNTWHKIKFYIYYFVLSYNPYSESVILHVSNAQYIPNSITANTDSGQL